MKKISYQKEQKLDVLNICVIGAGFIGTIHLKMYKLLRQPHRLVIIDTNTEKKKIAQEFNAQFYNDLDQALSENHFDLVDICLPTYLHYPVAMHVLKNSDAHLLIEKPLTLNYEEAKTLAEYVQKNKRIAMCAHVERFFQPITRLYNWMLNTSPPYHFIFTRRTKMPNRSSWFTQDNQGGGVLLDLGVHDIDILLWFVKSMPSKIKATSNDGKTFGETSSITTEFFFEDESMAQLTFGWDISQDSKFELINQIYIQSQDSTALFDSVKNIIIIDQKLEQITNPRYPNAYFEEIDHIVNCVQNNQKPIIDFREACKVLRIIETIKRVYKI